MLDYDAEAKRYDETRGGVPRAENAARAVLGLVPGHTRLLVDIGCGTGLVSARLTRPGLRTIGMDRARGMVRTAAVRLGRWATVADARRLPLPDESVDAVTAVWLLHLLPDASAVVAEAARVLRPGGALITTVDKDVGHDVGCDIDALLAPYRLRVAHDDAGRVTDVAAGHGLTAAGRAAFTGHGQGRTPAGTAADLRRGSFSSRLALGGAEERVAAAVAALPEPDRRRPDPRFTILALRK